MVGFLWLDLLQPKGRAASTLAAERGPPGAVSGHVAPLPPRHGQAGASHLGRLVPLAMARFKPAMTIERQRPAIYRRLVPGITPPVST
jgi:hypothetical protein